MFPLILNPEKADIIVIGNGDATKRRLELLDAAGASYMHHKTIDEWEKEEGQKADPAMSVQRARPSRTKDGERAQSKILFAADFDDITSAKIYRMAKEVGCLVNVEDKLDYCDFHVPAMVRRGELLLTISTGGGSPRLARRLRMMLEQIFPASWAENLQLIARKRLQWKADGASFTEVAEKTDALLDEQGWLDARCPCLEQSLAINVEQEARSADRASHEQAKPRPTEAPVGATGAKK